MLTREEQLALWNSIKGNLTVGTMADLSSSNNVNIEFEVDVHWNLEPYEIKKKNPNSPIIDKPTVVMKLNTQNRKFMQTLGDYWGDIEEGEVYGHGVEDTVLVKVYADDYGSKNNNFISKIDIANELMKRVIETAFFTWSGLFNGNVAPDNDYAINDVSEILNDEGLQVLQTTIRLQTFFGGVPPEGDIKYSTAPTLLEVESKVELVN